MNLQGNDKEQILREMTGILMRANAFDEETGQKIFQELWEREQLMSTGMQDGVALPHIKTEFVDTLRFVVGVKKEGLDFTSLDQKPSQIFVLVVAPQKENESYLQHLAQVSRFLSSEENRQEIIGAETNEQLLKVLETGL